MVEAQLLNSEAKSSNGKSSSKSEFKGKWGSDAIIRSYRFSQLLIFDMMESCFSRTAQNIAFNSSNLVQPHSSLYFEQKVWLEIPEGPVNMNQLTNLCSYWRLSSCLLTAHLIGVMKRSEVRSLSRTSTASSSWQTWTAWALHTTQTPGKPVTQNTAWISEAMQSFELGNYSCNVWHKCDLTPFMQSFGNYKEHFKTDAIPSWHLSSSPS